MTNTEILTKAIQKAIDSGWKAEWSAKDEVTWYGLEIADYYEHNSATINVDRHTIADYYAFIFNHDFAKALWGEDRVAVANSKAFTLTNDDKGWANQGMDSESLSFQADGPRWQIHLMQMVIAEDPIKYLGESLHAS